MPDIFVSFWGSRWRDHDHTEVSRRCANLSDGRAPNTMLSALHAT